MKQKVALKITNLKIWAHFSLCVCVPRSNLSVWVSDKLKKPKKDNLENSILFRFFFFSTQPPVRQYSPLALRSLLALSALVVFCVMEWLLRTWLLCLTLVDEVCLCLSALTCRNRDAAYSKINTQRSRKKEAGRARRRDARLDSLGEGLAKCMRKVKKWEQDFKRRR